MQKTLPVTKSICESSLRVFNISATFPENVALPAQDILLYRNLRMRRQCNNLLKRHCHCIARVLRLKISAILLFFWGGGGGGVVKMKNFEEPDN